MRKALTCVLVIGFFLTPLVGLSQERIPNAHLRVTVQQKEEGRINKGYHVLELTCSEGGDCSLSSVSLNQCFEFEPGKKAFFPAVEYAATWMGNLTVKNQGNSLVVQETGRDMLGDYVNNLRFDYEKPKKGEIANKLVGFSGGYVKNSELLKKVLTTEYVPLPKANQIMKLDCHVLLPGVGKPQ